jgi:hypothetical protein
MSITSCAFTCYGRQITKWDIRKVTTERKEFVRFIKQWQIIVGDELFSSPPLGTTLCLTLSFIIIIIIIIGFSCLLFQNIVVGIGGAMLSCMGDLTNKKQEALLFLTVSILTINVVNIVNLEVGEWHLFMTSNIQEIIGQKNLKKMVFYGIV